MENKNNISENPLENAPFLSGIEKKNDFSTPENYFKSIIDTNNNSRLENNRLRFYFDKLSYRFLLPISAITTTLVVLFYINTSTPTSVLTSNQISEVLINENYIDLDEDLIIEAYIETMENEAILNKKEGTIDDEYINYLIENDIDINTIINEL